MTSTINKVANAVYNTIVQIPFSVLRGITWMHCLPSHVNFLNQMTKRGYLVKVDPETPNPFYEADYTRINEDLFHKEEFFSHPYKKVLTSGDRFIRGDSELERTPSQVASTFTALIGASFAVAGYVEAVQQFGYKALIPLAITNAASLVHEIRFNRRVRGLDSILKEN